MTGTTIPANQDPMAAIERLDAKIDGVEKRLCTTIYSVRDELKAEISAAYDLHEQRIVRIEAAAGE